VIVATPPSTTAQLNWPNWTVPAGSSSSIVTVATLGVPRIAPPVGFTRATVKVSAPSLTVSLTIGTVIVRDVAPGTNVKNPPVASKSSPPVAVRPVNRYSTVCCVVVGPTRRTSSVTDPAASLTA
jgi:hypothetical protein